MLYQWMDPEEVGFGMDAEAVCGAPEVDDVDNDEILDGNLFSGDEGSDKVFTDAMVYIFQSL